jgi:DNA modification methylase
VERTLPLDEIICGDNTDVMGTLPRECIDLVVTSPPYDDLRTYGGHSWDFYGVAWQLKRVLKPGGVIVWVVGDSTVDGSETCTSMLQAMHFKSIGLRLHDTMIYHRQARFPDESRYWQDFEFAFVLSKDKPKAINLIRDQKAVGAVGAKVRGLERTKDGNLEWKESERLRNEFKARSNIWYVPAGHFMHGDDHIAFNHPATFPEDLARDHILSWSNEGDIVLDPFSGSGTTAKMARELGRHYIGIEINPEYCEIARKRLSQQLLFGVGQSG